MQKLKPFLLSVLSGLLLWASWPVSPFTWLIFFAFVPLIVLESGLRSSRAFLGWSYLTLLIWNTGSTWWVCNSTVPGGVMAIVLNSLLMCIPWLSFHVAKKRLGATPGYLSLLVFWLTFEYIHLNWELSWPWLTTGNVFAMRPNWVQWYEYTGSSGGTLWVMGVNILIAVGLIKFRLSGRRFNRKTSVYFISALLLLLLPVLLSYMILGGYSERKNGSAVHASNIVVVQPNIDPYQKFESGMQEGQLNTMLRLTRMVLDSNTRLVVWPETALNSPSGLEMDKIGENFYLQPMWHFLSQHPNVSLLTGIEGIRFFSNDNRTPTSIRIGASESYYESYNAAALLDSSRSARFYNKSKLVPGVETLPSFLRFLADLFEQFGGTTGGYTPQEERTVLSNPEGAYRIAPAICYESIYGEFLTGYVRNGADLLVIITNDGWWANTSGHKQHMHYARLRAIEMRRWVARSANTGISCFISPNGKVIDPQPWDTEAAIKLAVSTETTITFFARHGDIISRIAAAVAAVIFLWVIFLFFKSKLTKSSADA